MQMVMVAGQVLTCASLTQRLDVALRTSHCAHRDAACSCLSVCLSVSATCTEVCCYESDVVMAASPVEL